MKKKLTISVVALALVLCFAIGGTMAWLSTKTTTVTNTFTYGDINITLQEHVLNEDGCTLGTGTTTTGNNEDSNMYKMIPGTTLPKDPWVTVTANSEACWLFVKVEKSANFDSFMTYAIASGWTPLNDSDGDGIADDGIYYRQVAASDTDQDFDILADPNNDDKQITVKSTVTKADLNALTDATLPQLKFTAYAVQQAGFATAAEAWTEASKAVVPSTN